MTQEDEAREERIEMEIVVDAYGELERALGWYCYLEDNIRFPFRARCIARRTTSPLEAGDKVEVIGMPPAEECEHDMLVNVKWDGRTFAVPLSQLEGIGVEDRTREAIEDWRYWVKRGYLF